jgi:hypothetical protein
MIAPSYLRVICCVVITVFSSSAREAGFAQDLSSLNLASTPVTVGIDGHYRVGCWTAVRVASPTLGTESKDRLAIETLDGDGVRVVYRQPVEFARGQFGYIVPGSEAAPLVVRRENETIVSARFPESGVPARGPSMIPRSMPWLIVVGDPLSIDKIGANELLNRPASLAVTMPKSADSFPSLAIGYDGIDAIIITGNGSPILKNFSPEQQLALRNWLLGGGRIVLTLGKSASQLVNDAPWISTLLPEKFGAIKTTMIDPSALEAYTSSQTQLEPFEGAELPRELGQVLVLGRTTRKVTTPIVVDYVVGLGRVTVVAADLDSERFAAWPERLDLITRLTGNLLVSTDRELGQRSQATSYNDLAGQLRASLDQFSMKRPFRFSVISLIVLALIALVGPLDYLVVNRLFGRPLLGWITFPVIAIGLSVFLVWQSQPVTADAFASASKGSEPKASAQPFQSNRVELVDIDAETGFGRGTTWNYIYTHEARQISLQSESTAGLNQLSTDIPMRLLFPFGYPGRSLGGIQIVGDDSRMPAYEVDFSESDNQSGSTIAELALAPRSSKSISARYQFKPKLPTDVVVQRRRGSELLEGSITNPLPFDLLDGMLVYRNWAYLLPTRFRAGATIDSVDTLRQKNFRWQLSRQRAVESSSETQAWNPSDTQSISRVCEMLMFYDAVGGHRYTNLEHEVLSGLDLSNLLVDDRCMLIGRLESPMSRLSIASQFDPAMTANESSPQSFPETTSHTIMRLVIPVRATSRY